VEIGEIKFILQLGYKAPWHSPNKNYLSMLSITTETRLADLIGAIADNERLIEVKRQLLAEEPSFSGFAAFKLIDKLRNGYITALDIKEFMRDNGFIVTTEEASNVVEFFGSKSKLRLYYDDFLSLVMPADNILREVALRRDDYPEPLSRSAEYNLARVIQAEIDGNNKLRPYWNLLKNRYDYNVFDAFRTIDKYRTGSIMPVDLSLFLKRAGHIGRSDDAEIFIRRLDVDNDGKLSYTEFVNGLIPEFAQKIEITPTYLYSEKKPSYRKHLESPEFRSEYKPRTRLLSSERLSPEVSRKYESPAKSTYISPTKSTYVSPYKEQSTYQTSPYKSLYASYYKDTTPSKKLEFQPTLTPTKTRQLASELALALEEQISYERKFEHAKEELTLQSDFNLMDGFRVFDTEGKGFVTLSEFYQGLKDFGVNAIYSDAIALFKRLDRDNDGRVRYSEYCFLFTPKNVEYEKILTSRPPYHMHHLIEKNVYFTTATRIAYRNVLEIALDHERALEKIRYRLKNSIYFNVFDAFNILDTQGKGQISLSSV